MHNKNKPSTYWVCACDPSDNHHIHQVEQPTCEICERHLMDLREIVVPSGMGGVFAVEILELHDDKATVKVVKNSNGFDALPPFTVPLRDIAPRWKPTIGSKPKTIEEIKQTVDAGRRVHWANAGYSVIRDNLGQYLIVCEHNGSAIGLTNQAGTRLNGQLGEFRISDPIEVAS